MIYYNDDGLDNHSVASFIESAMENNPFYEEIHEKGTLKKLALPFKLRSINKKLPKEQQINDIVDRIKKHTYPAYNQYVAKCNDLDILGYLKTDLNEFLYVIKLHKSQFLKYKKLGKCSETERHYFVSKMFEKRGITVRDFDLTIKDVADTKKLIEKRVRELKKIQKESYSSDDDKYIMQFLREAYGDDVDENSIFISEKVDIKGELIDIGRVMTDPVNLLTFSGKNIAASLKWLKADIDVAKQDGKKYKPIDMERAYKVIKSHNDRSLKLAIDRTNDSTTLVYIKRYIKAIMRSCKKYQMMMIKYDKEGSAGIYNSIVKDMKEYGITQRDLEVTVKNLDKLIQDAENKIVELKSRKKKKPVKENGYDEWLEDNLDDDGEDNVASESPVSFVSQKSKPVKNQKAHLKYIKKKAHDNPTNNATGQKEMPSANSFNI